MARLYYMSLPGVGDWDGLLKEVGPQLRPYVQYLDTSIKAAKERKPVLGWRQPTNEERANFQERLEERYQRLAKRASRARKRRERGVLALPEGDWIVLEAPPWNSEETEDIFDAFLENQTVYDRPRCGKDARLEVRNHDREGRALLLEQVPSSVPLEARDEDDDTKTKRKPTAEDPFGPLLWLRPNTHTLECQKRALQDLESKPVARLAPLLRLVSTRAHWEEVEPEELADGEWVFLRQSGTGEVLRDGTEEQRRFVSIALATPDFALLEGPPGSGKTTAICELIAQLARRGMRILLVASTHVAVDNVLERLIAWQDRDDIEEKLVLPVRIGEEGNVTSDVIRPFTYSRLLATWRDELLDFLEKPRDVEPAGKGARGLLRDALQKKKGGAESPISRLLLESANLVCGTTIGILQHPAIKASRYGEQIFEPFDIMILDEASKTTFTEFLVPALHARRWMVVGDIKQLSPYVEEQNIAENLRCLVPRPQQRAALHAFLAQSGPNGQQARTRTLLMTDEEWAESVRIEAQARAVHHVDLDHVEPRLLRGIPDAIPELLYANLVFGSAEALARHEHRLPPDLVAVQPLPALEGWRRVQRAYRTNLRRHQPGSHPADEDLDWAEEVAWRLIRSYELRQNREERERHGEEIAELLPRSLGGEWFRWRGIKARRNGGGEETAAHVLERELTNIRRVAMPSILELLQVGFERLPNWDRGVALNDGLPKRALHQRLVSLRFQHRMHPHISAFSRERFYSMDTQGDELFERMTSSRRAEPLLQDASGMDTERAWSYTRYARRALWVEVLPHGQAPRRNSNPSEAERVMTELDAFIAWAENEPLPTADGEKRPWQVAVLTFYRGQEALLRERLQRKSGLHGNTRNFRFPPRRTPVVHVTLCTVDRFQGHEADLVLLSFVKTRRSVGFLNSPNRLNVALTRARYQLVLVGHRKNFTTCNSPLLRALSVSPHYGGESGGDIGWEDTP